jgi:hypothetical protein
MSKYIHQSNAKAMHVSAHALKATLVCTIGLVAACATRQLHETSSALPSQLPAVASAETKGTDARVRWSADRIEMLQGYEALLLGHVAIQFPSTEGEVNAGRVTRQDGGGPALFEGNVRIQVGERIAIGEKAVVTTVADTTLISMDQVHITRL